MTSDRQKDLSIVKVGNIILVLNEKSVLENHSRSGECKAQRPGVTRTTGVTRETLQVALLPLTNEVKMLLYLQCFTVILFFLCNDAIPI